MSGDSSEEKTHQASDVKLSKEREKGRIAKSSDLYAVSAALIGIVSGALLFEYTIFHLSNLFQAVSQASRFRLEDALNYISIILTNSLMIIILPFFGAIVCAVILSNLIYNRGIPISFDPISPKFERLNPLQGLKNIFGMKGMVGAAQLIVRLTLWIGGSVVILWGAIRGIVNVPLCGESCFTNVGYDLTFMFVVYACIILILVALFDMPIQKALFLHDQKMGNSEKKRENKDMFGSPEIKSARKQLQNEINSQPAQIKKIEGATIVIQGQYYATAIYYDNTGSSGPMIVENAKSNKMKEMLERAKKSSIPVVRDDDLSNEIGFQANGTFIESKHYSKLALAIVKAGISL